MSAHTKGQWVADVSDGANITVNRASWILDQGGEICSIYLMGDEGKANARLISAAPDLLAALQDCFTILDQCATIKPWGNAGYKASEAARAAILKATS